MTEPTPGGEPPENTETQPKPQEHKPHWLKNTIQVGRYMTPYWLVILILCLFMATGGIIGVMLSSRPTKIITRDVVREVPVEKVVEKIVKVTLPAPSPAPTPAVAHVHQVPMMEWSNVKIPNESRWFWHWRMGGRKHTAYDQFTCSDGKSMARWFVYHPDKNNASKDEYYDLGTDGKYYRRAPGCQVQMADKADKPVAATK